MCLMAAVSRKFTGWCVCAAGLGREPESDGRLAGSTVHRGRLVGQVAASTDFDVQHLSTGESRKRAGRIVREKRVDLFRRGRQTDQIKRDAADERSLVRSR